MTKNLNSINDRTQGCKPQGFFKLSAIPYSLLLLLFLSTTGCNKGNSNPAPKSSLTSNLAASGRNLVTTPLLTPVDLGTAANFTILAESGISTTGTTSIGYNIGVSPIASTAITGFGLIKDASNQFSKTPIVSGKVYASDYATPTPGILTTAVNDMETAFTTANGLTSPAPAVDLFAGDISGRTLKGGIYKWGTGVLISNVGVTLSGTANDVWVFQIAQNLTVNDAAIVTLIGGAQARHVFWVVSGKATLGTTVNFSGIILSKTLISLNTGAKVNGKLYAQTAVTLIANNVRL